MVKFGERLQSLKRAGWEDRYFTSSYERDEKWTEIVVAPKKQSKEAGKALEKVLENFWRVDFKDDSEKPWNELSTKEKIFSVSSKGARTLLIVAFLYLFICSLSFLADGFRLVAGKRAGEIFGDSKILGNPVSGLMVGVIATVLVQSSSTSTSITIAMVAAELLTSTQAIYIIMGANIGTSVTSTIVALGQVNNRSEFRRAFAAATIHDCFNFLTVLVLLPLEASFHYLKFFSSLILSSYTDLKSAEKCSDCFSLKTMTKPFTKAIVSIDKKLITKIATEKNATELAALESKPLLKSFWGQKSTMSDTMAGTIVLIFSLFTLCFCLYMIVKLLKSLLKGRIAVWMYKSVNGDFKDIKLGEKLTIPMKWLAGYVSMACGFLLTIMVQSSSITTSAMTPLVGLGVINLERIYPLVLGANMGTTITGILAALASDASKIAITLEVAYAHLLFNISGIVLFYVIWPLRVLPINAARFLGNTTAKYRWFALFYLGVVFIMLPSIAILLSQISFVLLVVVVLLALGVFLFVLLVNYMHRVEKYNKKLPLFLQNDWNCLPLWIRSLEPLDRAFGKLLVVCPCCNRKRGAEVQQKLETTAVTKIVNVDVEK
jgi:solute carrier family 34 (sodium-dependent phosphate cotransporter)